MRWVRGLVALLAILVVIAGAPVLLIGWGRPVGALGWRADDGSLLLAVLTLAGWLAWLVFTLATAVEVVRYASGNRFVVNLPLLGGLQALCAGLVLSVVALAVSTPSVEAGRGAPARAAPWAPTTVPAATARTAPAATLPTATAPSPRDPSPPDHSGPVATAPPPVARGAAAARPLADTASRRYDVGAGDDLWSIAERLLGDGRRWRELVAANPELLADPTRQLAAGTRLAIPAEAPERITVVRGDTLSDLAAEHLGRAGLWPRIADVNSDLIDDPDHIEVGWVLELPESPRSRPRARPTRSDQGSQPAAERGDAPPENAQPETAQPEESPPEESPPKAAPPNAAPPQASPPDASPVPPSVTASPTPAPATSEPEPAPTAAAPTPAPEPADAPPGQPDEPAPDVLLLGGLSAMAAAGLMGGWHARRLLQARVREPGRRVAHPSDDLARLHGAMGRRQLPDHTSVLDAALRAIGRHHHRIGQPLPALAQVTLTPQRLFFQWGEPAGDPPLGFGGDPTAWLVDLHPGEASPFTADEHPCAFPALVSLGTAPGGETVMVDVERSGVLGVSADSRELQLASLASLSVELACAPWAAELSLIVVGGDGALARTAGGETVTWLADAAAGVERLRTRHAQRARALAGLDLRSLRTDPERAEAVAPEVYVFHEPLPADLQDELDTLLSGSRLGLAAVIAAREGESAMWELFGSPLQPSGRLAGAAALHAHAIPEATRLAVEALYRVADATPTGPAPWWSPDTEPANLRHLPARPHPSEDPVDIVSLRPRERPHPTVMLIGPVDLTGAAGPEPSRSRGPLIEMAGWLLEHPDRTATQMAAGLGIAESTRRSNMSRLRSWLGSDEAGEQYLPDAYSGRIRLHPDVTSDVIDLRLLTGPGVNRIGDTGLVAALELIRGDVLADAAPGQWFWAEQLRSDVTAVLRDAALALVDRALANGDLDLARWAAERALVVAAEDELLICARIRTEHAAGNRPAVERYVLRLSHQARAFGVELLPETVMLCQQVMEGRTRARRA